MYKPPPHHLQPTLSPSPPTSAPRCSDVDVAAKVEFTFSQNTHSHTFTLKPFLFLIILAEKGNGHTGQNVLISIHGQSLRLLGEPDYQAPQPLVPLIQRGRPTRASVSTSNNVCQPCLVMAGAHASPTRLPSRFLILSFSFWKRPFLLVVVLVLLPLRVVLVSLRTQGSARQVCWKNSN